MDKIDSYKKEDECIFIAPIQRKYMCYITGYVGPNTCTKEDWANCPFNNDVVVGESGRAIKMMDDKRVTYQTSVYKKKEDNSSWWHGPELGLPENTWWTAASSHYDLYDRGPKRWVVHWKNEDGAEILIHYDMSGRIEYGRQS